MGVLDKAKDLDTKLSYQLFKIYPKDKRFQQVLKALEWSCHGIPWFVAVIALLFMYPKNKAFGELLVGLLLDVIVVAVTKALARRRRPTYCGQDDQFIVASVDKHSFPSGHASRAIYVALLYHHAGSFSSCIIWFWAISVVLSRIFLGRHHVCDVIAGFFVAFVVHSVQFMFDGAINNLILTTFINNYIDPNDITDSDNLSLNVDDSDL